MARVDGLVQGRSVFWVAAFRSNRSDPWCWRVTHDMFDNEEEAKNAIMGHQLMGLDSRMFRFFSEEDMGPKQIIETPNTIKYGSEDNIDYVLEEEIDDCRGYR